MKCQPIIKRLLYLRNWELFNIFFLPGCLYFVLSTRGVYHWQTYSVGMFCICFILVQGAFYWHLKLQSIRNQKTTLSPDAYRVFSFFNWANLLLLSLYPLLFVMSQVSSLGFQVSFWSNLLYIFAILEYINYYHYQLSHDSLNDIRYLLTHKKIRRSSLWTDLQRHRQS